jgi:hypothetical protein
MFEMLIRFSEVAVICATVHAFCKSVDCATVAASEFGPKNNITYCVAV